MNPQQYALLFLLAAAPACAGGSTMRVAGEDSESDTPVALAPVPETSSDSALEGAAPAPAEIPVQDTVHPGQGYAPYGNSGPLEIRHVGQWTHTGISEARRLVIRDANSWAQFWSELGVGERPAVDFTRDLVIAVAAGQRPTGGHEIAIGRVSQSNGELTAEVVETSPGPNCLSTSALSQPVDVVVVQGVKPQGWSFVERKEVRGCR